MFSVAIFVCFGWIVSVCIHEFGHAIVAYWGGDTSVKDKGYLTLNPLKYTDINLSLILPVIFLLIGGIALPGAAVYINHQRLRNRWWQSAVSAAGPISSAIVAFLLAIPFKFGAASSSKNGWFMTAFYSQYGWIWAALALLIYLEIYVIIINSLPIPSLDGYGVIEPWLPSEVQNKLKKFNKYAFISLFMLLWFVKPFGMFLGNASMIIAQILGVPLELIGVGFAFFNQSSGVLLLVAVGVVFLIRKLTRKPHDVWFDRGKGFSKSRQYEKAIAAYDRAIQIQPNNYEAWNGRGSVLEKLQRYEEAIASYDKASKINPDSYEAWYNKGWALNLLERHEEALKCYEKVIQIQPENYAAWHSQGIALEELQRYPEAYEAYDRALKIQPHYEMAWYAWYGRGFALHQLQKYEEAIASYDKAIKRKSDCAQVWFHRGTALDELKQYTEALKSYEKAIEIQPTKSNFWFYKGVVLCRLKRYKEAIATFERVIQANPEHTLAWYNKACCYAEQNNVELAIENLKQAIAVDETVRENAKTDSSFDSIRKDLLFMQLMGESA